MKKIVIIVVILFNILSFSCDDSSSEDNNYSFSFPTRTPLPEKTPISNEDIIYAKFENNFDDYDNFADLDNLPTDIKQTSDQGYIVLSRVNFRGGNDNYHIFLFKLDPYGNIEWAKMIEILQTESGFKVKETQDGGFVICGKVNNRALILKLDKEGNTIWFKYFVEGDEHGSAFYDIIELDDGSFIVVGDIKNSISDMYHNKYLIKVDYSGKKLWSQIHNEKNSFSHLNNIIQVENENILVSGESDIGFYIGKLDENGDIIWERNYDKYSSLNIDNEIFKISENEYLFFCGHYSKNAIAIKMDLNGNETFQRDFTNIYAYISSIKKLKNGGYIVAGSYSNLIDFGYDDCSVFDIALIKLDNNFDQVWEKTCKFYKETYHEAGIDVIETLDGGFAILGEGKLIHICTQYQYVFSNRNVIVVKTDENGNYY